MWCDVGGPNAEGKELGDGKNYEQIVPASVKPRDCVCKE
jgi:hypothetical protein